MLTLLPAVDARGGAKREDLVGVVSRVEAPVVGAVVVVVQLLMLQAVVLVTLVVVAVLLILGVGLVDVVLVVQLPLEILARNFPSFFAYL